MPAAATVVRRLGTEPGDLAAFADLVREAVGSRSLAASSDPTGRDISFLARIAPTQTAVAVEDGHLVGFMSPEAKALYLTPMKRRQGLGRTLVEEAETIERERGRPSVLLGVLPDDANGHAFLEATGFSRHSVLWELELPPERGVSPAMFAEPFVLRPFDQPRDLVEFVALYNRAFADHPTPLSLDLEGWDDPEDDFDRSDLHVLEEAPGPEGSAAARLVGFCWTDPGRTPDGPTKAEIFAVGVAPDRRGRGLGRNLLRWGVARLRSVGAGNVTLTVNGYNEGALALYESEGFVRTGTRERWARPVRPEPAT